MAHGHGISLLVPFRVSENAPGGRERAQSFNWLRDYWQAQLPLAEYIVGRDDSVPFCKTAAVNDAASRATGDILVILDADAYMDPAVLEESASDIRLAAHKGYPLWLIPYRRLFRLTARVSSLVMESSPSNPLHIPMPPPATWVEGEGTYYGGDATRRGHWFAAMVQVLSRDAFDTVGGMDERFRGWGGEDVSFMRSVDVLFGRHKTLNRAVYHMHHPRISAVSRRQWYGQDPQQTNGQLVARYARAARDPEAMRALLDER